MDTLPEDLKIALFLEMQVDEIVSACSASHELGLTCEIEKLWVQLLIRDYDGITPEILKKNMDSIRCNSYGRSTLSRNL